MMNWSKIVKNLRNEMLLTQVEFAEKLGVSFGTVNRWEKGYHEPTMRQKRQIKDLCKKFRIKMNFDEESNSEAGC